MGDWQPLPVQRCCQLPWRAPGPQASLANTDALCTSSETMPQYVCCASAATLAGGASMTSEVSLVDTLLALHAGAGEAGRLRRPAGAGLVRRSVSGSTAAELSRGVASARAPVSARGTSAADARWGTRSDCAVGRALANKAAELASARASLQTVVSMQVSKEISQEDVLCVQSSAHIARPASQQCRSQCAEVKLPVSPPGCQHLLAGSGPQVAPCWRRGRLQRGATSLAPPLKTSWAPRGHPQVRHAHISMPCLASREPLWKFSGKPTGDGGET